MLKNKDQILILAVSSITFLSLKEKKKLLNELDSFHDLALLSIEDISTIVGRYSKTTSWKNGQNAIRLAERSYSIMRNTGIKYCLFSDPEYPELLTQIIDKPFIVFYRGNIRILNKNGISVVGTRRITKEGISAAYNFAYEACSNNCNIISGLAIGTDRYAHEGSVNACFDLQERKINNETGKTIAVLPGGIDTIIPASHKKLAMKILETGGCIISEYLPETPSETWRFVQRNRIIAGLTSTTVVIQAPPGSGSLITADFALQYNRDLIFHKSAFCESAVQISIQEKNNLAQKLAAGKKVSWKLENTIEKYISEGASIIENYNDYIDYRNEAPGYRNNKIQKDSQKLLF